MSTQQQSDQKQEEPMPVEPISAIAEGMVDIAGHTVQAVNRQVTSALSPSTPQAPLSREAERRRELAHAIGSRGMNGRER